MHVIECASACTVTVQHEISLPLLSMSMDEAGVIAVAIAAIWAIGFAVRMCIRVLNSSDGVSTEKGD